MKTYLLVYDPDLLVDWALPDLIGQNPKVEEAYSFFGNALCIKTDADITFIREMLTKRFAQFQFFLVEIDAAAKVGLMPKAFWSFLKERELAQPSV